MATDKTKDLKETLSQIEKQFGKGSVMFLGDEEARTDIEASWLGYSARYWWHSSGKSY